MSVCRVEIPRKVTPRQQELLEQFAGRKQPSAPAAAAQAKTSPSGATGSTNEESKGSTEEVKPKKKGWFS